MSYMQSYLLNTNINDSIMLLSLPCIMTECVLYIVVSQVHFKESLSMSWDSSVCLSAHCQRENARGISEELAAEFWLGSLSFVCHMQLTTKPTISFVNRLAQRAHLKTFLSSSEDFHFRTFFFRVLQKSLYELLLIRFVLLKAYLYCSLLMLFYSSFKSSCHF